jgi:hypothetical protein
MRDGVQSKTSGEDPIYASCKSMNIEEQRLMCCGSILGVFEITFHMCWSF